MMHEYTSLAVCTLAVNWSLTFLAFLAVIAICWFGFILNRTRPSLDDTLIIVAFLISIILVSLSTWAIVDEGLGRHQQDVSASNLESAAKSVLVSEALWTLVTGLLRIAASLFIFRIFRPPNLGRCITIGIMVLSAALSLASIIQIFHICRPFAAQWDPRVLGSCGDQVTSFLVIETLGLLLDIGIFTVPSITIMNLHLPVGKRVAIGLIANLGAIVLVVTGLRMAALRDAISPDFTYSQSYLSLLSSAGCMTGVICCASPAIWRIATGLSEGLFRRRKSERDMEANESSPAVTASGNLDMQPGWEDHGNKNATNGGEERPVHKIESSIGDTQYLCEVNKGAVAILHFNRFRENELVLRYGQLVWMHEKRDHNWLLAENLTTEEIGLVPERYVQLLLVGGSGWAWDTKTEMRDWVNSHMLHCAASDRR